MRHERGKRMSTQKQDRSLEERVERLEQKLEERDEYIERLESLIEFRGEEHKLESLWIAGHPIGKMVDDRKWQVKRLDERVTDIEKGEVDPGELVAESAGPDIDELLPIHQMYLTAKNVAPEQHSLSNNKEIAARLFPHIVPAATPEGNERLRLTSPKVKDLIRREVATPELAKRLDVKNPNRNTVKRAMRFIGEFGGDVLEFKPASETGRRANEIVIDREAWVNYEERINDAKGEHATSTVPTGTGSEGDAAAEADAAFDQLASAQKVETDGGDVTPS